LKVPEGEEEVVLGMDYSIMSDLDASPKAWEVERVREGPGPMRRSFMRWKHKNLVASAPVTCADFLAERLGMLSALDAIGVVNQEGQRIYIGNSSMLDREILRWNKWASIEKLRIAAGNRCVCSCA
jgi:hypothetical protein